MPPKEKRPLFGARGASERKSVRELQAHSNSLCLWIKAIATVIIIFGALYMAVGLL